MAKRWLGKGSSRLGVLMGLAKRRDDGANSIRSVCVEVPVRDQGNAADSMKTTMMMTGTSLVVILAQDTSGPVGVLVLSSAKS